MRPSRLLLPAIAIGSAACGGNETKAPRPNVLLIVADDLGLGDVSCYGSQTINTPNIDALAQDGLLMRNAYATSATSTPSRFGLFTGMYPWRNPDAQILPGDAPLLVDPQSPTLPKMMQGLGYATAAVGKWHLGMGYGKTDWNKEITPSGNTLGFDYTNLIPATVDRVPTVYVENGLVQGLDPDDPILVNYKENFPGEPTAITNPEMMTMKWDHGHQGTIVNGIPRIGFMKGGKKARWNDETMADYFLSKVKSFMVSHKDEPFFLYYGLHQPHVPRVPNPRFVGSSGLGPRGDTVVEADW
ncbi:MAG: sulfatase-like hydrolase/transferase, partial [Bacteroidales bacterium]|nr:sulfatase-like hydrolase/transferase [Bacteroidales bacterium]